MLAESVKRRTQNLQRLEWDSEFLRTRKSESKKLIRLSVKYYEQHLRVRNTNTDKC
jgi:hypothetical protein